MEPTPNEVFLEALDALLTAVDKSAGDLRAFHDTVTKMVANARLAPPPPFPRATIVLTERILHDLTKVDKDLEEILAALGLTK